MLLIFLSLLIAHGHTVLSVVEQPLEQEPIHAGKNTHYEARFLKALYCPHQKVDTDTIEAAGNHKLINLHY